MPELSLDRRARPGVLSPSVAKDGNLFESGAAGQFVVSSLQSVAPYRFLDCQLSAIAESEFALMIGVSVSTLQNWEQGRRKPEGPAKALLKVASKNPKAVMDALIS